MSSTSSDEFTVFLSSNASLDVSQSNTLSSFRTYLPSPLQLDGEWEVALANVTYPRQVINVTEGRFDFYWDNPDHRKWYSGCKVEPGRYITIGNLIEDGMFSAIARHRQKNPGRYFDWNLDEKGILTFPSKETVRFKNMSKDLFYIFGCHKTTSSYFKDGEVDHPILPVDINRWHNLFVYGDFIELQYVGNSRAPLLQSMTLYDPKQPQPENVTNEKGGILGYSSLFSRSFVNPQFRRVSRKWITDIFIELRTETGDLVPFIGTGRTSVTLLFRKVKKSSVNQ